MKITCIRGYRSPKPNRTFNQSDMILTVETDEGITGIGDGGARDTLEQAGAMLIGEDPARINHLWQLTYRGWFYPPGREKLHALGALDVALWDIKGKTLGAPVYDLLGGRTRDYVECYSTGFPWKGSHVETARACIEAGFRAYRTAVADARDGVFDARRMVDRTARQCAEIREGVGEDGDWAVDFHTRLDLSDAVRLCGLIEGLSPLFVEDPVRSENPGILSTLRGLIRVPIAVGEQYGDRWEINEPIERRLIDFTRVTLPNVGGITEFMKIAALCETHYTGMIPHFTGPVALAALVHTLCAFSGPALLEVCGDGPKLPSYLSAGYEFRAGKLWPVNRPGLGVEVDLTGLEMVVEITERSAPIPVYRRPDGSMTNW